MILVSDNLQITDLKIEEALKNKDPEPIHEIVTKSIGCGAESIDINTGPLGKTASQDMTFFVNEVHKVTNLPLLLDTANPAAIEAGLKVSKNPVIINGFSLEQKKIDEILPLAKEFDVDIIGYLLNEKGHVPHDSDERFNIALELVNELEKKGIESSKLIIDPVVAPLIWENGKEQNLTLLEVIKILPDILGFPVRTIAGLSNLTVGRGNLTKRMEFERIFATMLSTCGLTMVLMNIFHKETVKTVKICKDFNRKSVFSWENDL